MKFPMSRFLRLCLAMPLALLGLVPGSSHAATLSRSVLLVMPAQAGALEQMVQGLRQALGGAAQVKVVAPEALRELAAGMGNVDVVIGVGSSGEQAARSHVAAAATSRLMSCGAPTTSYPGVVLEHDHAVQFAQLRRMLPSARHVGLVFHTRDGSARFDAAAQAARRAGLEAVALGVESAAEVQATVERLAGGLDALMVLPDAEVLSPQAARALLTVSMRQRVPLVGPAGSWVRAGALYALEWDYEDLGQQCADVAQRLLGLRAQPAATQPPRRTVLVINRRAAQHLRVAVPNDVLRSAGSIHE